MRNRMLPTLALLALAGSLTAGCSSSSSPSPASSTSSAAGSAPATTAALPAADCAVIKPIATGAAANLAPVQTEATAAAAATMTKYITQLSEALPKLTSAQAKTDLGTFIKDLKTASAANASAISTDIQKLATDCP